MSNGRIRVSLCPDPRHQWRHFVAMQGSETIVVGRTLAETLDAVARSFCTCPTGDGSLRWPCPSHPPGLLATNRTDGV